LIVNTDYPAFLDWLYRENAGLADASFREQQSLRFSSWFGVSDSYPAALHELGHEAMEIYINNGPMQRQWCLENGFRLPDAWKWGLRLRRGILPWATRLQDAGWQSLALTAQIKQFRPDVILNRVMTLNGPMLKILRDGCKTLVGQHAATRLSYETDYQLYDLVLSSFPATVHWFRRKGIFATYHKLFFDSRVLKHLPEVRRQFPLTFIGSLHPIHATRLQLLEAICESFDNFLIWTPDRDKIPSDSPLHARWQGAAWGLEMYQILAQSEITLNEHGAIAPYANNYRLYEATGVGTCLLTDQKENLSELFEPGKEVATYTTAESCIDQIRKLQSDSHLRNSISKNGLERTLREHNPKSRAEELCKLLEFKRFGLT